jgi:hypothetical protein
VNRAALIILLFLISWAGQAQEWFLTRNIKLSTTCELSSKDRNDNLYIADVRGSIYQYDKKGNQLNLYSTKQLGQIYLLESWQGLRTFAFYQDLQEYLITDRFLSNERTYNLSPGAYVRLATLSQDLNLWVLGEDNLVLQKLSASDQSIIIENQWSNEFAGEELNITYLKEYKNRLYLLDENRRVIMFDNLGNYITQIEIEGIRTISFTDQNLIANQGKSILKVDLNSLKKERIELPDIADQLYIIDGTYYLIHQDQLSLYDYKPL